MLGGVNSLSHFLMSSNKSKIERMLLLMHFQEGTLASLDAKLLGFQYIKELYKNNIDFSSIYHVCKHVAFEKFYRHDGYLFKEK